jgi:hypothetical protein
LNSSASYIVVAALADGRFVVTWEPDYLVVPRRARLFEADGTPLGDDFVLGSQNLGETLSYERLPDGRHMVFRSVLTTDRFSDFHSLQVYGRILNADGTPASNEFLVNTTPETNNVAMACAVAALADGRFVVVWTPSELQGWADGTGTMVRARIFNADGSALGNDFIVYPTHLPYPYAVLQRVTPLPDGSFVVTWTAEIDGFDIRGQIYDPQLTVFIGKTTADTWQGVVSMTVSPAAAAPTRFPVMAVTT